MENLENEVTDQNIVDGQMNKSKLNEEDNYMFGKKKSESKISKSPFTDEVYIEGVVVDDEMLESELIDDAVCLEKNEVVGETCNIVEEDVILEKVCDADSLVENGEAENVTTCDTTLFEEIENFEIIASQQNVENEENSVAETVDSDVETLEVDKAAVAQTVDNDVETQDVDKVAVAQTVDNDVETLEVDKDAVALDSEGTEVIYVTENDSESDDEIEVAKLAKLPILLDYILALNPSRGNKIKLATMLLGVYNMYKGSPENKAIVIQCLAKLMTVLQSKQSV